MFTTVYTRYCCVCNGTCCHVGPHSYCESHLPNKTVNTFTTPNIITVKQNEIEKWQLEKISNDIIEIKLLLNKILQKGKK